MRRRLPTRSSQQDPEPQNEEIAEDRVVVVEDKAAIEVKHQGMSLVVLLSLVLAPTDILSFPSPGSGADRPNSSEQACSAGSPSVDCSNPNLTIRKLLKLVEVLQEQAQGPSTSNETGES